MFRIAHFIYDSPKNPWVAGGGAFRNIEIYSRFPKDFEICIFTGKFKDAHDYSVDQNIDIQYIGKPTKNYLTSRVSYVSQAKKILRSDGKKFDLIIEDFSPFSPLFSFELLPQEKIVGQFQNYFGLMHHMRKNKFLGLLAYFFEKKGYSGFQNGILISEDHRDFVLKKTKTNF